MAAVWTKYFADKNTDRLLADFEQYASCARRGGTIGAMRDPGQDPDEDIRVSIVQQYLKLIAFDVGKRCWAIPINCTLTRLESLWEELKNVRMHEYDNQDVEFSLSVQLTAYSSNVISVWVYIAMFRDADGEDDDEAE